MISYVIELSSVNVFECASDGAEIWTLSHNDLRNPPLLLSAFRFTVEYVKQRWLCFINSPKLMLCERKFVFLRCLKVVHIQPAILVDWCLKSENPNKYIASTRFNSFRALQNAFREDPPQRSTTFSPLTHFLFTILILVPKTIITLFLEAKRTSRFNLRIWCFFCFRIIMRQRELRSRR